MNSEVKPALAAVFGHFSNYAEMSEWRDLERFMNPCGMFRKVHVLALGDDREYPSFEFGSLRVHRIRSLLPKGPFKRLNDVLVLALGTAYLWWMVRKFDIDLIAHMDSTPVKFGVPAVFVGKRTGLPSLITLHSDYAVLEPTLSRFLRTVSRILWPYLFRACSKVRSVSRPIAEFAFRHGVPREKVEIIPNKENLAPFYNVEEASVLEATAQELDVERLVRDSLVFLSVGRLIPVKNLDRCLAAFAIAREQNPSIAYFIVGTGPLLDDLKGLARSLGISDRVRFLGYFSHQRLGQIYHLSDVFLFPTLWEGHPRVVLEAMAARLPIICSSYGAVTDLVGSDDGIHVDPTQVAQISEAMGRLAGDAGLRTALSRHPSFNPQDFSIETINKLEASVYTDMLMLRDRATTGYENAAVRPASDGSDG